MRPIPIIMGLPFPGTIIANSSIPHDQHPSFLPTRLCCRTCCTVNGVSCALEYVMARQASQRAALVVPIVPVEPVVRHPARLDERNRTLSIFTSGTADVNLVTEDFSVAGIVTGLLIFHSNGEANQIDDDCQGEPSTNIADARHINRQSCQDEDSNPGATEVPHQRPQPCEEILEEEDHRVSTPAKNTATRQPSTRAIDRLIQNSLTAPPDKSCARCGGDW